jgi:hypothetical protein
MAASPVGRASGVKSATAPTKQARLTSRPHRLGLRGREPSSTLGSSLKGDIA